MRSRLPDPENFWSHVQKTDTCWLWAGCLAKNGYGKSGINGKTYSAHRVAYELSVGSIPDGKFILHRCDVRKCVNPDHLFVGTQKENIRDMHAKGRGYYGGPQPGNQRGGPDYCHGRPSCD